MDVGSAVPSRHTWAWNTPRHTSNLQKYPSVWSREVEAHQWSTNRLRLGICPQKSPHLSEEYVDLRSRRLQLSRETRELNLPPSLPSECRWWKWLDEYSVVDWLKKFGRVENNRSVTRMVLEKYKEVSVAHFDTHQVASIIVLRGSEEV